METIRSVGVCLKQGASAHEALVELAEWLPQHGLELLSDPDFAAATGAQAMARSDLCGKADLVVCLGGDGTLLAVARELGPRDVPILGVNLGTLGFLTEVNVEEMLPALEGLLEGKGRIETRTRLDVSIHSGPRGAEEERGRFLALNDAVISQTALSRLIRLATFEGGSAVTTFHADGLIVATPTGSTAYSLSAGGPILQPGSGVVVLTPICPHALTHRPVVFPDRAEIEVEVDTRGGEVALTVDGQEGLALRDGDRVRLRRSEHPVRLVSSPIRSRYEILRAKLRWGER